MQYLKLLGTELQFVEEIEDPEFELEDGEEVIGTLSEQLQKLYTYKRRMRREIDQMELQIKWAKSKSEFNSYLPKWQELKFKEQVVDKLFWVEVRSELNSWDSPIGVRKGFQVVKTVEDTKDFGDFLRGMLGGG